MAAPGGPSAEEFDADRDCHFIKEVLEGIERKGSFNEVQDAAKVDRTLSLVRVFSKRSADQRAVIVRRYNSLHDKYLAVEIKEKVEPGPLQNCLLTLLRPSAINDAVWLHAAIAGLGTDEGVLIEILCMRTPQELVDIQAEYKSMFKRELMNDVMGEFNALSQLRELLIGLLGMPRKTTPADPEAAHQLAEKLHKAGKGLFANTKKFVTVFTHESHDMLKAAFQKFKELYGLSMESFLDRELKLHSRLAQGLKFIASCAESRYGMYADLIHDALNSSPPNIAGVERSMLCRLDTDMAHIKEQYLKKYDVSILDAIKIRISDPTLRKVLVHAIHESEDSNPYH
ncbi:hypothetical protein CBR_g32591 [Chara braunii]|uniref:Annexin n=1 Tax=Chara braunii TaxID=69332 RepID=A0A388LH03_CHABU|nr:hypothetical protein CBR_g32591 [Chara braunii]|eukprot:GBG81599.1 hypothetical protein CBR_g32591 [Chara braunii]